MIIETNDAAERERGGERRRRGGRGMCEILVSIVMCECAYACVMCKWQKKTKKPQGVWGRDDWQRISER